jgi:enolase-phosphatase E1
LFKDVAPVLKRWHEEEMKLAIFSSGSVEAQKLFFRYVDPHADLSKNDNGQDKEEGRPEAVDGDGKNGEVDGPKAGTKYTATESGKKSEKVQTEDLNPLFSANFDTINAGPKMVAGSYEKIVKELEVTAEECLFLSDNVKGKF